uniref:Uncharacterized protein TCIL3000_10_2890 n=1 Tax=Trypanosoma congolense (strain IL3000) TaxID=1068625 RepID=G0UVW2_TRYCI|nr:unnamed protein product [Trypanosoma congolense IL3000]
MGRDSRGDRYSRRSDVMDPTSVAKGSSSASSSRYGRYAGRRRSRSPRGSRRSSSEERYRRRRHGEGGETGRRGHHRSRSRSRSLPTSPHRKREGERARFETVDVQELLQPSSQSTNSAPTPPATLFTLLQQQQPQNQQMNVLPTPFPPAGLIANTNISQLFGMNTIPVEPTQGRDVQTSSEIPHDVSAELSSAPAKVLPSVADFVPVIPKSLIGLLSTPATGRENEGQGGVSSYGCEEGNDAKGATTSGVQTTTVGTLVTLQAPKLSPEAERRAREARRAHVSCFPRGTSQEELLDYFRTIIPIVRRIRIQREMDQITEEMRKSLGNDADAANIERREIPLNAIVDVDRVIDLAVNSAKSKPFGFLEVSLADLVTELVEESIRDPDRFTFVAADGKSYPITIRRPRDYQELPGVDRRKVVMLGFPPTLPSEKLRLVFEQFGPVVAFDVKGGMAYSEFEREEDAVECVRDLHGEILGNRVVVLLPLHDWLKVVCTHADIDVSLDPDDPVAGTSLLAKNPQNEGALVPLLAEDAEKKDEPVDHMKELLELVVHLPDVVLHFAKTFPHLTSLYGSTTPIFPTRILVLMNLFDEEELVLDETYERLVAEISEEVEKHGRVKSLIIPRRTPPPIPPKLPKSVLESRMGSNKGTGAGRTQSSFNNNKNTGTQSHEEYVDVTAAPSSPSHSPGRATNGVATAGEGGASEATGACKGDVIDEEYEKACYERAKAEFIKAREAYAVNLLHPIHGGFGRVFVEYESLDEAAIAQREIAGRLFGGRTVVTSFMFEDVLYPPTEDEKDAHADDKLKAYLESVGAGDDAEESKTTPDEPQLLESAGL